MIPHTPLPTFLCQRCGHKWVPRIAEIWICPNCKSKKWQTPKEEDEVQNIGERQICERLKAEGWEVYRRGWPDLCAVRGDEIRFIEVKSPKKSSHLSVHQKAMHQIFQKFLKITVEVIRWEENQQTLKLLMDKHNERKYGLSRLAEAISELKRNKE